MPMPRIAAPVDLTSSVWFLLLSVFMVSPNSTLSLLPELRLIPLVVLGLTLSYSLIPVPSVLRPVKRFAQSPVPPTATSYGRTCAGVEAGATKSPGSDANAGSTTHSVTPIAAASTPASPAFFRAYLISNSLPSSADPDPGHGSHSRRRG